MTLAGINLAKYIDLLSRTLFVVPFDATSLRHHWGNETLTLIAERINDHPHVKTGLGDLWLEDASYAAVLTGLVKDAGGWTSPRDSDGAILPLTKREQETVTEYSRDRLCDFLRTFSQFLFDNSHSEPHIRLMWRARTFDEHVRLQDAGWGGEPPLGDYYREDGQYNATLTQLVKDAGDWAGSGGQSLSAWALTPAEQAIVDQHGHASPNQMRFLYRLIVEDPDENPVSAHDVTTLDFAKIGAAIHSWTVSPAASPLPATWKDTVLCMFRSVDPKRPAHHACFGHAFQIIVQELD